MLINTMAQWHKKQKQRNLPPAEAAVARASIVLPVPKCRERDENLATSIWRLAVRKNFLHFACHHQEKIKSNQVDGTNEE